MKRTFKRSLKSQFILIYALLVLVPFTLISVLLIRSVYNASEESTRHAAKSSFDQTTQLLEYYIDNIDAAIDSILGLDEFHKVIEKDNTQTTMQEQINDMLYLRTLLNSCRGKQEISDVYLYLDNEAIYIGENSQVQSLSTVEDTEWYQYVENNYPGSARIPGSYLDEEDTIGYARSIRNSSNYTVTAGVLFFKLNKSVLTSYLGESEAGAMFIINSQGDRIAQSTETDFSISTEHLTRYGDGSAHVLTLGAVSCTFYATKLEGTDWYLVYLEPYISFTEILTGQIGYLFLFLLSLTAGLIFFYWFSRNYLQRISAMTNHMSKIEESLPAPMETGKNGDEIDNLIQSYNYMLARVDTLMKKQYELGNQVRGLELKALYEQINPHFLYNTLTMISWLAEDGQTADVSRAITALSSFYRISLNNGNENITLEEELEIAENYTCIQQMRMGTDIRLDCQVDSVYNDFVLPKLTLQPLIENALMHGILKKRDRSGVVTVEVAETVGRLLIIVRDNGVGISPDIEEKLNREELRTDSEHYGIWNVLQRIRLFFGDSCTLTYTGREGEGTTATLSLPYR